MITKISIVKNDMTDEREELVVFITEKSYDALINALYPARNRDSKGYVTLVNFLYKEK